MTNRLRILSFSKNAASHRCKRFRKRQERHLQITSKLAQVAIKLALPAATTKLASSGGKARWKGVDAKTRRKLMRALARKRWAA
jgi:hypothetical protein